MKHKIKIVIVLLMDEFIVKKKKKKFPFLLRTPDSNENCSIIKAVHHTLRQVWVCYCFVLRQKKKIMVPHLGWQLCTLVTSPVSADALDSWLSVHSWTPAVCRFSTPPGAASVSLSVLQLFCKRYSTITTSFQQLMLKLNICPIKQLKVRSKIGHNSNNPFSITPK